MWKRVAGVVALTVLATAATAQAPAPPPPLPAGEPETVTSEAQRERQDNSVALDFLRTWLDPSYPSDEQFAFWRIKLCPRVWGLTPEAAGIVEHRIREVAHQVGAPVDDKAPCTAPYLLVIVTPDPQGTLDDLADKVPILVAMQDIKRLTVKYPIQSWYVSIVGDYDGHKIIGIQSDDGNPQVFKTDGRRLENGLQFGLGMATIIIDAKATTGMSLATIADYTALAGLSETVQRGFCHPVPTIANLMVKDCPAENKSDSLTDMDLEMLKGLYLSDDAPGLLQRQKIARVMREMMNKARPAP